jgi:hypothetical protein
MSRPSKLTVPDVGSTSPSTARPIVVLPDPDSPTNPRVSPGRIPVQPAPTDGAQQAERERGDAADHHHGHEHAERHRKCVGHRLRDALRGEVRAAEVALQRMEQPVPVLDEHRLVEPELAFGLSDLLRGRGLAEDDAGRVPTGRQVQQHVRQQGDAEQQHHPGRKAPRDVAAHGRSLAGA